MYTYVCVCVCVCVCMCVCVCVCVCVCILSHYIYMYIYMDSISLYKQNGPSLEVLFKKKSQVAGRKSAERIPPN